VTACQRWEDRLEAYHDGELSGFSRWRVARHLGACPHCRSEVEGLRAIAGLMREQEAAAPPAPDLWAAISARLPAIDAALAQREAPAERQRSLRERRGWAALLGPLPVGMGGLAVAAVAIVLWLRLPGPLVRDDVVEELDAMGRSVAVLPSDDKSTIIWVLDPKPVARAKEAGGAVL
jgi:anti-sigma factor RsiW